jgi:hypothetical protein
LLELQPRLSYNLIGHNCEHIANMCAAVAYTESHQMRTAWGVHTLVTLPFLFWFTSFSLRNQTAPKALAWGLVLSAIAGPITIFVYNRNIKQFWHEIKGAWLEHERMLSEALPPPVAPRARPAAVEVEHRCRTSSDPRWRPASA